MKTSLPIFLLLTIPVASIHASDSAAADQPYILVVGQGEVSAKPDQVVLNFGIETTAKEAKEAQEENARRAAAVLAALKKNGVAEKNVKTTMLSLSPRYDYVGGKQVFAAYMASKNFEVRLDDIDRYGSVLQATLDAGVNQMTGVRFDHSNRKDLEEQALKLAVMDARKKADIMASAAGQKIIGILSIEAGESAPQPRPVMFGGMRAAALEAAPPDQLAAGESTIRASATVRFKI